MNYIFAAHTDVGIRKSTNQDSVLIMTAESDFGPICMGVICDGMGGLANGELASATLIRAFQVWFRTELPKLLVQGFSQDELRIQWNDLIHRESRRIADHGGRHHMRMGTTVAASLPAGSGTSPADEGSDLCSAGNGTWPHDRGRGGKASPEKCSFTMCGGIRYH